MNNGGKCRISDEWGRPMQIRAGKSPWLLDGGTSDVGVVDKSSILGEDPLASMDRTYSFAC